MSDQILNLDFKIPILQNLQKDYSFVFVALHPFYKEVFHEKYNYLNKLDLTYQLIETISWDEIANDIDFKKKEILGKALHGNKSLHTDLLDYLEYKNLELPEEHTIPLKITIPILKTLAQISDINSLNFSNNFSDKKTETIFGINKENVFEISKKLVNSTCIKIPDHNLTILLPQIEFSYSLILMQNNEDKNFIKNLQFEGFFINDKTMFNWWDY